MMGNPFSELNPMNGYDFNSLRSIMRSSNPMQVFQSLAMNNPRLQPIMRALQGGANPRELFDSMCRQRGIDPNEFIRRLTDNNGF